MKYLISLRRVLVIGIYRLKIANLKFAALCLKVSNRRVRLQPLNGQQVLVRAKVSLYEPRGDFQLIIEQMEDAGEGVLRQQYEQLKNKLNGPWCIFSSTQKSHT